MSQHLLLDGPNDRYISSDNYKELKKEIPKDLYKYVVKSIANTKNNNISNEEINGVLGSFPDSINTLDYEKTVANLLELMNSDNTNFVYSLLNFEHPIYSLETISKVKSDFKTLTQVIIIS